MKSKAGKEFSARLKLLQDGKVDFIFDKKKLAPRGANYVGGIMEVFLVILSLIPNNRRLLSCCY